MLVAAELATARGTLSAADRDTLRALITAMGPLPAVADLDAAQVVEAVGRDKKVIDGRLHYVLPVTIGETTIADDVTGSGIGAGAAGSRLACARSTSHVQLPHVQLPHVAPGT